MLTYNLPNDPVFVVGVITKAYGEFTPIAVFESIQDAAWYAEKTGVAFRIEPHDKDSVLIRDVKINTCNWN